MPVRTTGACIVQIIVDIYWFSGTGNTLLAVRAMREEFVAAGMTVNLFRLETADPEEVDPTHMIGIACPVAVQGAYPLVWKFVRALPSAHGTGIFLLDTLLMYSGGIVGPMRRLLEQKEYHALGAAEILMPNNFLRHAIDTRADQARIEAGCARAREFARDLLTGNADWAQPSLLQSLIYWINTRSWIWRLMRRVCPVGVNKAACVQCGLCMKLCPVGNIIADAEKFPRFADRCELCHRCLSFCPKHAITLGGKTHAAYQAVPVRDLLPDAPASPP